MNILDDLLNRVKDTVEEDVRNRLFQALDIILTLIALICDSKVRNCLKIINFRCFMNHQIQHHSLIVNETKIVDITLTHSTFLPT